MAPLNLEGLLMNWNQSLQLTDKETEDKRSALLKVTPLVRGKAKFKSSKEFLKNPQIFYLLAPESF